MLKRINRALQRELGYLFQIFTKCLIDAMLFTVYNRHKTLKGPLIYFADSWILQVLKYRHGCPQEREKVEGLRLPLPRFF